LILTRVATIFLSISLITGVFGMNFIDIPGLKRAWEFVACMVCLGVNALGMMVYFRKKIMVTRLNHPSPAGAEGL
jgi:magnesium transporter